MLAGIFARIPASVCSTGFTPVFPPTLCFGATASPDLALWARIVPVFEPIGFEEVEIDLRH